MEALKSSTRSWEQQELINDIKQGQELANQLQSHLYSASTVSLQSCYFLVENIIHSYEKTLSKLNASTHLSSCSDYASIHQDYKNKTRKHASKKRKRKVLPKWTEQVQVQSDTGQGPLDNRYRWIKYGQKDIHGAIHPRGYYRCTGRDIQGCLALKQVQRSDQDPTIFHITYIGQHTCTKSPNHINLNTPLQLQRSDTEIINPLSSPEQVKQQKRRKFDQWHDQLRFSFRVDNDEGAPEDQIFPTFSSFPTTPKDQMLPTFSSFPATPEDQIFPTLSTFPTTPEVQKYPTLSSFPTTSGSMSSDNVFSSSAEAAKTDQFMSLAEGSLFCISPPPSESDFYLTSHASEFSLIHHDMQSWDPYLADARSSLNPIMNSTVGIWDFPLGPAGVAMDFGSEFLCSFLDSVMHLGNTC